MSNGTKHEARTFFVDTRFERMARRPGGVNRKRALSQAQSNIEKLKPEFANWLDSQLPELRALLSRAADVSSDAALIERAYRNCSHLQDVGATMGFSLLTFVAKNLCKILDAASTDMVYDKDIVDCHVNALLLARTEPYCNKSPDQVSEMTTGLRRVVELASNSAAHKRR
jgi:hypothetical protein